MNSNPVEAAAIPPRIAEVPVRTTPPGGAVARRGSQRHLWRYVIIVAVLGLPLAGAVGVTGYFRLSSPTKALRGTVMNSVPGQWDKRFAIHAGGLTMGLVRCGSRLFHLPPEPRAALDALHGAEVGVYRLQEEPASVDYQALFLAADKSMKRRGWGRIVGVAQGEKLVAIYIPRDGFSAADMECCLLVLQGRDLVVASARGNLEPLLELARAQPPGAEPFGQLRVSSILRP